MAVRVPGQVIAFFRKAYQSTAQTGDGAIVRQHTAAAVGVVTDQRWPLLRPVLEAVL
jgi:hypothetical protein